MSRPPRRLAFVGPLPPVRSGIADYAADLLPHLGGDFEIELFVGDDHPLVREGRYGSLPLSPARDFAARASSFDAAVYQMGNNRHHEFVLDIAEAHPGIVVLHDVVLHHLYEHTAEKGDEWERYATALRRAYGASGDAILRWKRWRLASERETFAFPLFEPLGAVSRGILVHNRAAEEEVRRRLPGRAVRRMPMGIPRTPLLDAARARQRLGIRTHDVVVASFGFITPIKRIDVLARAFRAVRFRCPELRLVLIGEASPAVDVESFFEPEDLASGRVLHRGYVSTEDYRDWMAAADLAVNLRFPTAGETSASLLRSLGDGKCTLVSAYRQFLEIPGEAVVRIPLGGEEEATLVRELSELARDPARRRRIGDAARAFIEREHSMEAAAAAFAEAVRDLAAIEPLPTRPRKPLWALGKTSRFASIRGEAIRREGRHLVCAAGTTGKLDLVVRNQGDSEWLSTPERAGGHVSVGGEILSTERETLSRIAPVTLARDLPPCQEESVSLTFRVPQMPGEYRLQPTLVHHVGRGLRLAAGGPISLTVTADARD